jgi:hypothetical protein
MPPAGGQEALYQDRWTRRFFARALGEKLVKIGAKAEMHSKYVLYQLTEVAVPRKPCAAILKRIGRLRLACASA